MAIHSRWRWAACAALSLCLSLVVPGVAVSEDHSEGFSLGLGLDYRDSWRAVLTSEPILQAESVPVLFVAPALGQTAASQPEIDPPGADPLAENGSPMSKGRRFMIGENRQDTASWVTTGVLAAGLGALLFSDDFELIRDVGDITQLLPVALAIPATFVAKDRPGLWQFGLSGGTSFVLVHGIKESVEKWRPDLADTNSFPSGHTNASFVGAAFIQRRYGPRWGVPAYVMASYTGLSRVAGNKHFVDDVVGGMSLAFLSNWLFVEPMSDRFRVTPIAGDGQIGLNVAVKPGDKDQTEEVVGPYVGRPAHLRFEFEFGGATVRQNLVTAPSNGTTIDWRFSEQSNPTTTSAAGINWFPKASKRHQLLMRLSPFEVRDKGVFQEDTEFAGETFPANEEVRSRYIFYEYRTRYSYRFFPESNWNVKLGGAASVQDILVDLAAGEQPEQGKADFFGEVEELSVLPLAHIHLGYQFAGRYELFAEADGAVFGTDDDFIDYSVQFRARIGRRWDLSVGFRRFEYRFETQDLKNDFDLDRWFLGYGYSW